MGNPKMANHVKFVRPVYLRRVRKISKGKKIKIKDIVQYDYENFDEELFKFLLDIKKKTK